MSIIPVVHCRETARAVNFYTTVLDFEHVGSWPELADPAYTVLMREGCELHLSSYPGDGTFGRQAVAILTPDAAALFSTFRRRGLDTSRKPDSPVHQGVVAQTWDTLEFYVDDPDGNSLCFIQR